MRLAVILAFSLGWIGASQAANGDVGRGAGLDVEVHAAWARIPLRAWTARASSLAGKPVILDRRIDPDRPVTLTARGEALRDILSRVAAEAGGAVDELESTIRIVPLSVAGKARQADAERRQRMAKASASTRRLLAKGAPWTWPAAARPRDLLETLAADAGLPVHGIDTIPHDHFPAADLPRLSVAERFDLVLAHFDRRVVWSTTGSPSGRIVAIDAEISPDALAQASTAAPRPAPGRSHATKVREEFTLRLEAPLDQALQAIGNQLDLAIEVDRESLVARGVALGEIARADVSKASREELLDAILHPLGLAWRLDGKQLRVFAPAPGD